MTYNTIVALALLGFLALVGLEYAWSRKKGIAYYRFSSSMSNISTGIAERLLQLFVGGYFYIILRFIYQDFSFYHLPGTWYTWLLLFLMTDFLWYWYHRLSHTVNLFWAAHIVHHQSEEYNLTVSFRITIIQAIVRFMFYLPLPFLGFLPEMILVTFSICGIYQFFIHTRVIKSLGIFENVFVTPSHHRVHHGNNTRYLDKNYGGVLIIWDKLFDTFEKESEEVTYGLTKQVDSNSFLWLHFHFYLTLLENSRRQKRWADKLKIWFIGPDKIDYRYDQALRRKYLSPSRKPTDITHGKYPVFHIYIYVQILLTVLALFFLYFLGGSWAIITHVSLFILLTLVNCGAILEQKEWVFSLEIIRGIFLCSLLWLLLPYEGLFFVFLSLFFVVLWNYSSMKERYLRLFR